MQDKLNQLISIIDSLKTKCLTEEATKHSLVLPFINILGYDVFNPLEVVPEFTADLGIKKGEKIDYAIIKNGEPIILIECKHHNEALGNHHNQLIRYFHTSKAKFGILTNGTKYLFYSDLDELNKMDAFPFLEIDLENLKSGQIDELKKFQKESFDSENILASASTLKYINKFKNLFAQEISNPSEDFTKYFAFKVLDGKRLTSGVVTDFNIIVKKGIAQYISETINSKLKIALNQYEVENSLQVEIDSNLIETQQIVTTDEEMEGFYIVKSICREFIDPNRIQFKDNLSYFNILVDGKVTKWIARLSLNGKVKYLYLPSGDRFELNCMDDLYQNKELIIESLKKLI
jgi:predicted type IV restriction endonuclease